MPKFSKRNVIFILCFIIIFTLQDFVLKPIIKEKYLYDDLKSFEIYSWKYTLSIFLIIATIIIFKIKKSLKLDQIPVIILALIIFGSSFYFGVHNLIDNSILYINSITEGSRIVKTYHVVSYKENKTFWLNNTQSIHDTDDLEKINKTKIRNGLKSIFEYKNNDTVKITFNKGLINVNYLK